VRKSQVNQVLYRRRDLFRCEGDAPPRWFVRNGSPPAPGFDRLASRVPGRLYAWQREALGAWLANDQRGIVQAVTGAGKTELGLAAIETHLANGGKAAVIVPGIDLARQWEARISDRLPAARLGVMGDGSRVTLDHYDVLVAVGRSASQRYLGLNGDHGLLVADEVHRYATSRFMEALEEGFDARLGLTATLERDDGAHETHLLPYFKSVVYTLGYERALADEVIAPYKVALVGVSLTYDESTSPASSATSTPRPGSTGW
jgi:RNA polymerase primary sigma factor